MSLVYDANIPTPLAVYGSVEVLILWVFVPL